MKYRMAGKLYKNLHNRISKTEILSLLKYIWAYSNYLSFNKRIPNYVDKLIVFDSLNGRDFIRNGLLTKYSINPYNINLLSREICINSQIQRENRLLKYNDFIKNLELVSSIGDEILKENNIDTFSYLWRLQFEQFHMQEVNYSDQVIRYLKIYSYKELSAVLTKVLTPDFQIKKILVFSLALTGHFLSNFEANSDLYKQDNSLGLSQNQVNDFLKRFSTDIDKIVKVDTLNENYQYIMNPLVNKPILKINGKYYCPQPYLLIERVTRGLRYELLEKEIKGRLGQAFGKAFELYCQEISHKLLHSIDVHNGEIFKLKNGLVVETRDIIITDKTTRLLVECKGGVFVNQKAKEIENGDYETVKVIVSSLTSSYKSINQYRNGLYPSTPYNNKLQHYLWILILDNIFLLTPQIEKSINENLEKELIENGLSIELVQEFPWKIISISNYERLLQYINEKGIKKVMKEVPRDINNRIIDSKYEKTYLLSELLDIKPKLTDYLLERPT